MIDMSFLSFKLKGQVALVTGAAGALGSFACQTFAQAGADIVLVERDKDKLLKQVNSLEKYDVKVLCVDGGYTAG